MHLNEKQKKLQHHSGQFLRAHSQEKEKEEDEGEEEEGNGKEKMKQGEGKAEDQGCSWGFVSFVPFRLRH